MKRFLSITLLFLCLVSQAFAENASGRTVRVGFPPIPGYNEISMDGTFSGYDYDYLKKISQENNWKYQFVVASWNDCVDMLKKGEIDILGGMERTPGREKQFNFAQLESFLNSVSLFARPNDKRFLRKNLNEYKGLTVGVLKGSQDIESLKKYSREHKLKFKLKEYVDLEMQNVAFKKGEFDILLSSGMNKLNGLQILVSFSPKPHFYAVRKNAPAILQELNSAQSRIKSQDRFFDYRLYEKHYGFSESNRLVLTQAERNALDNSPPMRVAFVHGWRPLAYLIENETHGIVADLLSSVASSSGLRMQYVNATSHEDAVKLIRSGQADTIAFIVLNNELADTDDLKVSIPFLQIPVAMLVKTDRDKTLPIEKVGFSHIMNKQFIEDLSHNAPSIRTIVRKSPHELLDALVSGEIDAAYVNIYSANSFLSWPQYSSISSWNSLFHMGK